MSELRKRIAALRLWKKEQIRQVRKSYAEQKEIILTEYYREREPEKARLLLERRRIREERRIRESVLPKRYTIGEEIFNSVTHGIGAGLSIAAIVLLIIRAVFYAPVNARGFYVTGFSIFGASLFILYLMSTLYHALTPYGAKKVFAVFDHSSIYLLIAGTYTPFCLTVLRGTTGWVIFGVIWSLAVVGITFYAIFGSKMRIVSVVTYILMGWLIIFAIKPMVLSLPALSIKLLFAGGIAYTIGCIFYALKKIKWMHCIWHLFVMAGSVLHFFSVYFSI